MKPVRRPAIEGSRRRMPGTPVQAAAVGLLAAVVLTLVSLDLWRSWRARDLALVVAGIEAQNAADSLAQQVARSVELIDLPLKEVQQRVAIQGLDPDQAQDLATLLRDRARATPQLRDLVVLDRTGHWFASSFATPLEGYGGDREFFVTHRSRPDRDLAISAPYISRSTGHLSLAISRRLDDAQGRFVGVVLAAMDLSFFDYLSATLAAGQRGAIGLFRSDGVLLARQPVVPSEVGRSYADDPLFRDHVRQSPSGSFIASSTSDGITRLETYRRLDEMPVVVQIAIPENEALADWRGDFRAHVLGMGLLVAVVALLAWRLAVLWRRQDAAVLEAARLMADYRLLADNAGDMIVVNDLATLDRRYVSPAARAMLGVPAEALVGTNLKDSVHPDDMPTVMAMWQRLKAGEEEGMSCHRVRHADGHWVWVEENARLVRDAEGRPTGEIVAVVRDVGARVAAERAQRESEERFRAIAENATDMIIRLTLGGQRVYVSPAYREILGYDPDELQGGIAGDIVLAEDRQLIATAVADLAAGRRDVAAIEYRVHHKDGHLVWVDTRLKLVRDGATGRPVEIVGVVRDNSQQKADEEKLEAAREEAERSNRMRSAFFSNMSHELRTPLNAVIGFADLMRQESLGPLGVAKYREYVEDIHASGEHLLQIINDILDFAKLEAGALSLHQEPVSLTGLVAMSCRLMATRAEQKGVELQFDAKSEAPEAMGDPIRIKQVLLNLLSNAIKFTPAGGRVTVTAGVADDGAPAVWVSDTGIGIAPEDLQKVIEPFGQVDNARNREGDGTGLGLPLSHRLMEMHGGTLQIASSLGSGTTVTAKFLRAQADGTALAAAEG